MFCYSLPLLSDPLKSYQTLGFAIVEAFTLKEVRDIQHFATSWVNALLHQSVKDIPSLPLENYHIWSKEYPIPHGEIFKAMNRHRGDCEEMKSVLLNARVRGFLSSIGVEKFDLRDEGLGWLAFRFIRPGAGDGYPMTKKEWGIAKEVISFWVPVIGSSDRETIALVPGSHLKEYDGYLPENQKFRKDEYRLKGTILEENIFRPSLNPGDVVIYHPKTLHSEDVQQSTITRLNLEFRIQCSS